MSRPTILLNPGPVTLSDRVRAALLREDQCHREPEFAEMMLDIKARLAGVYPQAGGAFDAIALTGSGTCAVEAMVASLAPREGGKTLVVANGVYGERVASMLRRRARPYHQVRAEWTEALPLEAVEDALRADPSVTHLVAVHNETTTGRLNDIDALLEVAARYGVWVMLDAVSSFGAEALDFAHPRLLAVASTGNKCLHGIVGIAFVLLRREAPAPGQAEALYLDLFAYREAQASGYSPFTQAVHACFALQEALAELADQGGWAARRERYRSLSSQVRSELAALGVDTFLDPGAYSSMISSFVLPRDWTYQRLHDALRAAGFVIYAGQGGLYHAMFRICTMGDIRDEDLERLLRTLRALLA